MVEKRRGLGRGLGALIPSAPADEERPTRKASESADVSPDRAPVDDGKRKQEGRPVDLFFERVTEEDVAEQPRSYSSALRSGINKNVLEAQTKRVGKTSRRSSAEPRQELSVPEVSGEEASPGHPEDGPSDKQSTSYTGGATEAPDLPATGAAQASAAADDVQVPAVDGQRPADNGGMPGQTIQRPADNGGMPGQTIQRPANNGQLLASGPETAGPARDDSVPSSDDGQGSAAAQGRNVSRETSTSVSRPSQAVADGAGPDQNDGLVDVPGATFADLPLDSIHPNRKQPRLEFDEDELAELVHSIREIGVLQPIVVRPSYEGGDAPYELVMGERRWRASRDAGMETIPAIIRVTLDDDLLRDALLENLHRSALNPLEEAAAYQQLLDDFGCSHDELAGRLGRSRPQISNTLRLMKLPALVQRRVAAGVLSAGHARALLGLADVAEMEKLAQRIVSEGLSVRSTEEIVALSGGLRRATRTSPPKDGGRHERLDYLATSLSDRLDTNVKITLGAKKGRVSIEFASVDDLNRIVSVLSPSAE